MKILLLDNTLGTGGGVSTYVENLRSLISTRHEVRLFGCVSNYQFQKSKNETKIKMPRQTNLKGFNALIDVPRYFWNRSSARYLRALLQDFKPDVIHINSYHGHLTPSILNEIKKHNIPTVQTLHGFIDLCPAESMLRNGKFCDQCAVKGVHHSVIHRCNRRSILRSVVGSAENLTRRKLSKNKIDKYLCVSEFQKKILSYYDSKREFVVLENFTFPNINNPNRVTDEYIMYPTRLIENKGVMELIKIYACDVQKELPKVKLIGTGELESYYKHQVEIHGLQERILFCGFFDKRKLNLAYANCLAVLNFSQLNETFGLTVIEAMASNKFVFVSDCGALPSLVNEKTGTVINFNQKLEDILELLIRKLDHVRRSEGNEIFRYFQTHYGPQAHLLRLEKIYIDLIKAKEKPQYDVKVTL